MRAYTAEDIYSIYNKLLAKALCYASNKKWERSLKFLEASARWAYEFNFVYRDENCENLLKRISKENIEPRMVVKPNRNRCALLDTWCVSNRGLTQQYLRAMMSNGMEILYISLDPTLNEGQETVNELKCYDKAKTIYFANSEKDDITKAKQISKAIADFSPQHVFLHIAPWETAILLACYSLSGTFICNANLTDHAFWMGSSCIDYNFEFRAYGETVSIEKRGLSPSQLIRLPFYPIKPLVTKFDGLPKLPSGCVKVLTGGTLNKMLGKNDVFFKLMDVILGISPNVVIFVAGFEKDKRFDRRRSRMKHGDRVIQIGRRQDIDAVFDNVDIYLGTYPMCGGLMSQYAASHSLPIIAYHDEEDVMNFTEELVNHYQNKYRSFSTIEEMRLYATKLINDKSFRKSEGEILHDGIMTPELFSIEFKKALVTHRSAWPLERDKIDYSAFFNRYLDLENHNNFSATKILVTVLKFDVFKIRGYDGKFSKMFLSVVFSKIKRLFRFV